MTKNSFLVGFLLPGRHLQFERKRTLMSQLKGVCSLTCLVGGLGPRAEFGDGLSVKFLKLLNRRQSLLIVKLLKKVKMKYLFGWLAGNVNFYKEEVLIVVLFQRGK